MLEFYIIWFIIGFGVNGENGISYAVVAELRITSRKGFIGGIMQGFYALGALLGAVTATFATFKTLFLIAGLISLLSFAFYPFIPEERVRSNEINSRFLDVFSPTLLRITILGSIVSLSSFLFIIPTFELIPTILKNDELIAIGIF
nr:MFS transporter [Sulfolobus sp. E11-6]